MSTVYTIGYEGTDIDRLVETLKTVGVRVLADVRAVALSRKKGFSKNALKARLADEGIAYLHVRALGDPKPGREAARAGRHIEFKTIYSQHLKTNDAAGALIVLRDMIRESATCLLCYERDPNLCHRKLITERLAPSGISAFDLFGDLPSRYANNAAKLTRRNTDKSASAAQQNVW